MSRYTNTQIDKIDLTERYADRKGNVSKYNTTYYKRVPKKDSDVYVITTEGDRLDNLAFQFYGDPHLWWFIANVNGLNSMAVKPGISLRLPASAADAS